MMPKKELEDYIIKSYEHDEKMMILIFAQWCINNKLDPIAMYTEAYPDQMRNEALAKVMELTVSKDESEHIPDETVLNALQAFGNDDLAFIIQATIDEKNKKRKDK